MLRNVFNNKINIIDIVLFAIYKKVTVLLERLDMLFLSGYDKLEALVVHVLMRVALNTGGELDEPVRIVLTLLINHYDKNK
jgi:hypothetical protein